MPQHAEMLSVPGISFVAHRDVRQSEGGGVAPGRKSFLVLVADTQLGQHTSHESGYGRARQVSDVRMPTQDSGRVLIEGADERRSAARKSA